MTVLLWLLSVLIYFVIIFLARSELSLGILVAIFFGLLGNLGDRRGYLMVSYAVLLFIELSLLPTVIGRSVLIPFVLGLVVTMFFAFLSLRSE
ncbi:MAG TPA: hypothetical protein GYA06_00445 [Chloroflexi bacterium]|jgi:lipoprotein signal peptidase|nr:hypothetical protein [Chloroflexota bacterium]HPO59361.1 hypothetical protein [Anaerolineaceae bacterium]